MKYIVFICVNSDVYAGEVGILVSDWFRQWQENWRLCRISHKSRRTRDIQPLGHIHLEWTQTIILKIMDEATKEEKKTFIAEAIQLQTASMLKVTANIVDAELKATQVKLKEDQDDRLAESSRTEHLTRNNINESNYEFCRELEDVWNRTERAVTE